MIAVISDIHGNLAALKAVIADAQAKGCTNFISLGDVVSYYCQPNECIDILMQCDAINILGNHDSYIVNNESCPRSKVVSKIIEHHKAIIGDKQLTWLKKSRYFMRQGSTLFVHGGPEDPQDQYMYKISEDAFPEGVKVLFGGHTHVQVKAKFGERIFCNPGSVGQPRDGDSRAAYATLKDAEVELHRVKYDISKTADAMQASGYEPFYYENLYKGAQIGGRIDSLKIIGADG